SSMRNGGTPASSRLLLAACSNSFSAAESSSEDDPTAEIEWGVGCLSPTSLGTSLRISTAGGFVFAAQVARLTANIANETKRARSMIFGVVFRRGDRRQSSAFHLSR